MPPLSNHKSTIKHYTPHKLPFLEISGGIAQLGAPANGGNPPRCRETTIQSKSPETLEIQWFPVIWGYSSAGSLQNQKYAPIEQRQSTTSYSVPEKLPFMEIFGGIAQLGACKIKSMPPLSNDNRQLHTAYPKNFHLWKYSGV